MKRLAFAVLLAGCLTGPAVAQQAPPASPAPLVQREAPDVTTHVSPGGQPYRHVTLPRARRVALTVSFPFSVADVAPKDFAVPVVALQTMANGGAGERDAAATAAAAADLAARVQLSARLDEIDVAVTAGPDEIGAAAALVNDMMLRPHLEDRWIERNARRLRRLATRSRDNSNVFARAVMLRATVADVATRNAQDGGVSVPVRAEPDTVRAWAAGAFRRDDLVVATAGPGNGAAVGAAVDRLLQGIEPSQDGGDRAPIGRFAFGGRTFVVPIANPVGSSILAMGPLPNETVRQAAAVQVAADMLGDGLGSRLMQALRTRARLAYGFQGAALPYGRDGRVLNIAGTVRTEGLERGLRLLRETYEGFRGATVPPAELAAGRRIHVRHVLQGFDQPDAAALYLADVLRDRVGGGLAGRLDPTRDVTAAEIAAATERFPPFSLMTKVILTADPAAALAVFPKACVVRRVEEVDDCP